MIRTRFAIGCAAVAVLVFSACSSDSVANKIENAATETTAASDDTTTPDSGTPDSGTDDTTLPGLGSIVPEECRGIYNEIIGAMASAMVPGSNIDVDKVFGAAKDQVPAELQGDVELLASTVGQFAAQMQENPNDPATMQAIIAAMSKPEVTAASDRIQAYFDETCPE
jgi:hypothetical protein